MMYYDVDILLHCDANQWRIIKNNHGATKRIPKALAARHHQAPHEERKVTIAGAARLKQAPPVNS